ncbi:unnamed protein product, partial [Ectocarpus sp. 13 AM-2016]
FGFRGSYPAHTLGPRMVRAGQEGRAGGLGDALPLQRPQVPARGLQVLPQQHQHRHCLCHQWWRLETRGDGPFVPAWREGLLNCREAGATASTVSVCREEQRRLVAVFADVGWRRGPHAHPLHGRLRPWPPAGASLSRGDPTRVRQVRWQDAASRADEETNGVPVPSVRLSQEADRQGSHGVRG